MFWGIVYSVSFRLEREFGILYKKLWCDFWGWYYIYWGDIFRFVEDYWIFEWWKYFGKLVFIIFVKYGIVFFRLVIVVWVFVCIKEIIWLLYFLNEILVFYY